MALSSVSTKRENFRITVASFPRLNKTTRHRDEWHVAKPLNVDVTKIAKNTRVGTSAVWSVKENGPRKGIGNVAKKYRETETKLMSLKI